MSDYRLHTDLQEALALHSKASHRRDELLARAQALHVAGELRRAGALTREAQTIQRWLTALEGSFREGRRPS